MIVFNYGGIFRYLFRLYPFFVLFSLECFESGNLLQSSGFVRKSGEYGLFYSCSNKYKNQRGLYTHKIRTLAAMGGQHGYCGLWLDQEYGAGHTSETCTTYSGFFQMSYSKEFQYRHLEVWGLGAPPPTPQERGERVGMSVLEGNQESKTMLKLAGRTIHSEGFRETDSAT